MIRLLLLRLLESYFRHRWLYLLPIIVVTAAGLYQISRQEPSYISQATVYVQGEPLINSLTALRDSNFGWVTPAAATRAELQELQRTEAYLRTVVEGTKLEQELLDPNQQASAVLNDVRGSMWVSELGSNLIVIGASHQDPQIAHELVSSSLDAFVEWKLNKDQADSYAALVFFTDLVETYRAQVEPAQEALTDYLTVHPEPIRGSRPAGEAAEIARLQTVVDGANERLGRAESKLEDARLVLTQAESAMRQTYFVIDQPSLPTDPEQSLKKMIVMLGLFIASGFFITLIGVVGGGLLDSSLRFPLDVHKGLDLPVLAVVPESKAMRPRKSSRRASRHATDRQQAPATAALEGTALGAAAVPNNSSEARRRGPLLGPR